MDNRYYLREITKGDARALRTLHVQSLGENPSGFIQPNSHAFRGYIDQRLTQYMNLSGELVGAFGRESNLLAGVGGIVEAADGRAELCDLFVRKDFQRQGIGRNIVQHLINRAHDKGLSTVVLHVTATQTSAQNLYKSLGFVVTSQATIDIEDRSFDTVYMEHYNNL